MAWCCETCPKSYESWRDRERHLDNRGHYPLDFTCAVCNRIYSNDERLRDHEIDECYYCSDCDRKFISYNNIKMHLHSRVHVGTNASCPFCKNNYATVTGLIHHIETGSCPRASSLNRDTVYQMVRSIDRNGTFSKNLVDWKGETAYEATAQAWNGWAYECYLCHHKFKLLQSLNQHLKSPAHQQALYHCPNRVTCGREFKTLAAVMNHLESETCTYTRFENVQNAATMFSGYLRLSYQ
ncbi:hypothetical protein M426DRAFT_321474 [Hypoxylon sp. CI-4A]|nr:hypothetical protein M426DRAFT_321474 [Hypoxylon sp. CI-4A]